MKIEFTDVIYKSASRFGAGHKCSTAQKFMKLKSGFLRPMIFEVFALSGKCQGNPFPQMWQGSAREILSFFAMLVKYQGNLTLFTDLRDWCNILKSSFSSLCHNIFCEIHMVERSKECQSLNVSNLLM